MPSRDRRNRGALTLFDLPGSEVGKCSTCLSSVDGQHFLQPERPPNKKRERAQTRAPIFEEIRKVAKTRAVSFQTPGHTGGAAIAPELSELIGAQYFRMDVSVCAAIDSLSHPHSFIRESERLLAQAYGSKHAFFLVNGSTTGNLAMMLSTLREGDEIILPRSIHRSIIHALALVQATPIWVANDLHPDYQIPLPLTPAQIAEAVRQHPRARAVFVNSPTYHGVGTDIEAIADVVHHARMILLADEAWGAHLAFHPDYPTSAADKADLCVQSMHKTLPVTNQGAVLHCNTARIPREYIANILSMFQTTSPSYVLLSAMDVARRQMVLQGFDLLEEIIAVADYARRRINTIPGLHCLAAAELPDGFRLDPVKVTIRIDPRRFAMTGYALEQYLCERYGIQVEMSDGQTVLLMIKPGIIRQDIDYLLLALQQLQHDSLSMPPIRFPKIRLRQCHWETVLYPFQTFRCPYRLHPLADSAGEICWESIYAYPPGTPVVMPGECLTQEIIGYLQELIRLGAVVKGVTERGEVLVCESPLTHPVKHHFRRRRRTIPC